MFVGLVLSALLAALTLACSAPPEKERHQAEGALAAARAAEAAIYAPAELSTAEVALQKYDTAVAQRDYRQALNFAIDARDRAYVVARLAGERKAAARGNAERLIAEFESVIAAARARTSGAASRLGGQVGERLRAAVKRAAGDLQEARSRLDRQDYRGVTALLGPRVEAIRRDLAQTQLSAGRRGRT